MHKRKPRLLAQPPGSQPRQFIGPEPTDSLAAAAEPGSRYKPLLSAAVLYGLAGIQPSGAAGPSGAPESTELEPVIIRERRLDPAEEMAGATAIDLNSLVNTDKSDLDKVLRGAPGVTLLRNIRGTPSSMAIRGAGAGQGQVVLDGIPLYSTLGGAYSLDSLPPEALDQMVVERGASVIRYGSLASGGAIRLSSRNATDTGARFRLQGGSFGSLLGIGSVTWAGEKARATLTGKHDEIYQGISQASAGLGNRERDGFRGDSALFRYTAEPLDTLSLSGSILYADLAPEIDLFDPNRGGLVDTRGAGGHNQTWMAQQTLDAKITDDWQSSLQVGYHRSYVRLTSAKKRLVGDSDTSLLLARWKNRNTLDHGATAGEGLHLTWGAEARQEQGAAVNPLTGPFEGTRGQVAGLLDLDAAYGPWMLAAGGRFDHYDHQGTHGSYFVNSAWRINPALSLRAGAGHVYRLPSLHELHFPFFSSPNLVPESSNSGQFGFDWTPADYLRLQVTGFYNHYRNKIRPLTDPVSGFTIYSNMPDSEVAGVEWEALYERGPVTAGLFYTFQGSQDLDTGLQVARVPEHQGRLYGEWRLENIPLALSSEIVYRSGYYAGPADSLRIHDAWWVNTQAQYTVAPQWQIYVRGENLSNDKTPDDYRFGKPGAAVYGGIKVAFQ